jgi:hypothetical protein
MRATLFTAGYPTTAPTHADAVQLTAGDEGDGCDDPSAKPRESQDKESQDQILLRLAEGATLARAPYGEVYARVGVGDHTEVHRVRASSFRRWITKLYYDQTGKSTSDEAVKKALGVIEARAQFEGQEVPVFVRMAVVEDPADPDNPTYFLDLGDATRRAVRVTREGWSVVSSDEVSLWFRRPNGLRPLPLPVAGGSLDEVRPFVNLPDDRQWKLFLAVLVAHLCPVGPYPVLGINGEQGSSKSTLGRVHRALIDPSVTPLRSAPRDERDLMIAATNSWVLNFDNLDSIPAWLSNALCRLRTGGGFTTRQLYSDGDEVHFDAQRPVLVNGIEDVATRGDLADRAVILSLPTIPEKDRREESEFWRLFREAQPRILGGLLDGVSGMLRLRPSVKLKRLPRMADFARRGEALGRFLGWGEGEFLAAYEANRGEANETVLEASPFALAVLEFHRKHPDWKGTATELLPLLVAVADEATIRSKGWPKTANDLGGMLTRLAPSLRDIGIEVERTRVGKKRQIAIRARTAEAPKVGEGSSPPSPSSPTAIGHAVNNGSDKALGAVTTSWTPVTGLDESRHLESDGRHNLSPPGSEEERDKSLSGQWLAHDSLKPHDDSDDDDDDDDPSPTFGEPTPPDWEEDVV